MRSSRQVLIYAPKNIQNILFGSVHSWLFAMADSAKAAKPTLKPLSFDGKHHDMQLEGQGVEMIYFCHM